jgi:hypothetical protein
VLDDHPDCQPTSWADDFVEECLKSWVADVALFLEDPPTVLEAIIADMIPLI